MRTSHMGAIPPGWKSTAHGQGFPAAGLPQAFRPEKRARAIVEATTHYDDPDVLARVSRGLGEAMRGIEIKDIDEEQLIQFRGW